MAHIASEFRYNDPVINPNAIHFAVSQSGETADTLSAVKEIQLKGGDVHGIVNVVGSTIARLCGKGVYIHSGPEQAVASTKAASASYLCSTKPLGTFAVSFLWLVYRIAMNMNAAAIKL